MKLPLRQTVKEQFSGLRPILCANLPYNITTPFLTACVEAQCFDSLTVLIQRRWPSASALPPVRRTTGPLPC